MTTPAVDEVTRRIAATTGMSADEWRPAVVAWWAAGLDLNLLLAHMTERPDVIPYDILTAIRRIQDADDRAARTSGDQVAFWTARILLLIFAASLAVVMAAAAWKAVLWAWT